MRPWTDKTNRHTHTQTRVTTIHFSWSSTHAKCNKLSTGALHSIKIVVFASLTPLIHNNTLSCGTTDLRGKPHSQLLITGRTNIFSQIPFTAKACRLCLITMLTNKATEYKGGILQ